MGGGGVHTSIQLRLSLEAWQDMEAPIGSNQVGPAIRTELRQRIRTTEQRVFITGCFKGLNLLLAGILRTFYDVTTQVLLHYRRRVA